MKKSTFDFKPQLVDYEGAVVRINFDVEKVTESFPSMGDGEPVEREVFKACVVRVPQPLTVEAVKAALLAEGFSEIKANAVATEAIFIIDGSNDLSKAKAMVLAKITEYDNSDDVNGFIFGGKQHWIPREYRVIYGDRLAQEMRREHESVSFDLPDAQPGDAPLTLDVETASLMLEKLNDYATDCYDVTKAHERNVAALTTVKKVLAYDFTHGYPEKINFDTMFAK